MQPPAVGRQAFLPGTIRATARADAHVGPCAVIAYAPPAAGSVAEIAQSSGTTTSGLTGSLTGGDVDGDTLTYGIVGGTVAAGVSTLVGAHGTLTVTTATGAYAYTPNAAFAGTDTFQYQARDAVGAVSNAATVTITVTASGGNHAPVANNDAYSTNQGTALTVLGPSSRGGEAGRHVLLAGRGLLAFRGKACLVGIAGDRDQ